MPIPTPPKNLARLPRLNVKLPKKDTVRNVQELEANIQTWARQVQPPASAPQQINIRPVALTRAHMDRFAKVRTAAYPLTEMAQTFKLTIDDHLGVFYSALVTHEYLQAQKSYDAAMAATTGKTPDQVSRAQHNWNRVLTAFGKALKSATLPQVGESDFRRMAKELTAQQASYSEFLTVYQTGVAVAPPTTAVPRALSTATLVPAAILAPLDRFIDHEITLPPNWCGFDPIQGVYTKSWSAGFDLKATVTYPCGLDCNWDWFDSDCSIVWCQRTFSLISGSVSFTAELGYKIDCCGAAAWGSATGQACGSIASKKICASCTAAVASVAGQGRTTRNGDQCNYGLGVLVSYSCNLAGHNVVSGYKPIGWAVVAPCPPAGICPN